MNPTTSIAAKHIMNTPETLVSESIQGLCYTNPNLRIIERHKVVYYAKVKEMALHQVTLISGGGSGHEPGYAGFVGKHALAASVCGHVFASPSSSQVLAAIQKVASPHGTLVIIMNYTGDCLNFGLAVERAKAQGIKVDLIAVGDDIAVGKSNNKVGRRGLAATALAIKMAGALASQGATLSQVKQIVQYVIDHSVTLGVALNHCHVPGSTSFSSLKQGELELGMGIHNEAGFLKTSMMPAKELVERMMAMLMDQNDTDRSFLKLSSGDFCVLLVNNLGGLSQLELNLVVKHAVEYILLKHNVVLQRVYVGSFVTSLNMPGFSLSLLLVDNQQGQLELLDQPVQIPGWPSCPAYSFSEQIIEEETIIEESMTDVVKEEEEEGGGGGGNNSHIRDAICSAAKAVIKAEPLVTEYDTILGDGDCGQTLKTAALAILQALPNYPFHSIPKTVLSIADTIEQSVGGTSSAIYCIYLNALASGLLKENDDWVYSARYALDSLKMYTQARLGDRTLMDTLCPFIDTLNDKGSNITEALQAAQEGCERTFTMSAKLGRASYLSHEQVIQSGIPDAGAYGLLKLMNGLFSHK